MAPMRTIIRDILVLFCILQGISALNKCPATSPSSKSNSTLDLVPNILVALAEYKPCEPGDPLCLCHAATITKDLEPYSDKGISQDMISQSKRQGTLYKVIRGRIFRQEHCSHPLRCSSVEDVLLEIAEDLPDLEFVLNVCDWPQVPVLSGLSGPVFSHSTTALHLDIMCPAWSFWTVSGPKLQHYPHGLGRWDWMRQHLAASGAKILWKTKKQLGFFRGSRSSPDRDNVVILSKRYPNLVDAQYTLNVADRFTSHILTSDPAEEVPLAEHCHFKYLFSIRGVAASFRLRHILLCRSLVLHVGDQWQEFFYAQLKPWVHYVPVASNASVEDIADLLRYLHQHDDLAEEIAERGHQFVWTHLRMADVHCYWSKLLQEYAKLLTYQVKLEPGFYEVSNKKALQLYGA
ncbi:O-glucosyltransferase rumi [Drosophila bipectinata]|uniref:O-glucosyltransferase rumi n=1 Tax=Drosophila bipectinata TaxID=42026 RepID=UPI0038B3974A